MEAMRKAERTRNGQREGKLHTQAIALETINNLKHLPKTWYILSSDNMRWILAGRFSMRLASSCSTFTLEFSLELVAAGARESAPRDEGPLEDDLFEVEFGGWEGFDCIQRVGTHLNK